MCMVFIIYMLYLMQMVTRNWMYNADRRSEEFINGVHYFLSVAETNKRDGFMCCPCAVCKNLTEYSNSRTLHSHLLKSGFVPNYICWTKHGESGIIMDEGEEEEEEELDHANIIAQYGGFNDVAMGEIMKKRWRQKMIGAMMLLVMPSVMHKENVKVIKRKPSSSAC